MEKKYFIDSVALKRLLDPQPEIRCRTLREFITILNNNILFTQKDPRGNGDELSVVSLEILIRHLIRWFQFRPVLNEAEVLNLLLQILSRKDFLRNIVKHISISRLKKEFNKISNLILEDESYTIIQEIFRVLSDYETFILIDIANATGSFSEVESSSENFPNVEIGLVERMRKLKSSSPALSVSSCHETNNNEVKDEVFWEKLDGFDLDTFNGIDAELSLFKENEHLTNILNFLITSIHDYPPEFFLQPPNILESLLSIISKVSNDFAVKIIKLIKLIVNELKDRWLESMSIANETQSSVSVNYNINNIFQVLTDFFERFHDSFNPSFFKDKQEVLNEIYLLVLDIAGYIKTTKNFCQLRLNNLMNMIAFVAKDLRVCYATALEDTRIIRMHYMTSIYIFNVLAANVAAKVSTEQRENNVWEFECDVALLDVPLKIANAEVYSLVEQNRKEVVKTDEDLSLMLNCQKSWTPTVHLFQKWKTLDNETIVLEGVEALSTIRFHQNIDFVRLLLNAIYNCSKNFVRNVKLEKAAQDIYLRLLSIEIPEVRRATYSIAKRKVQEQLQVGIFDKSAEEALKYSICSVVGIPITNEIVTEILCFGFTEKDSSIQSNSRTILFALLRSKITCGDVHWIRILNIIRPVLPLMTCMFATDEQMGYFSLDIYNWNNGIENKDLYLAWARHLYCSHPKARNIAKTKLLERFPCFNDKFINIIPDDFCIIPTSKVTDILIPESKIGYDNDTYEAVHETLKTMDRSNKELLKSVLLKLSVMMNSRKLCERSHDDNIWIYLMASPDMGCPRDRIMQRLVVNIIMKWAVTVPDFRMYLASEANGLLQFLITTLVYFQDDANLKMQASWLLFLLLFSDFIVISDKNVSMPQILSGLCCPFKTEYHWTESPFNQISALEHMHEVMSASIEGRDVFEMSDKFLKFTFALEWFKGERKLLELTNLTPKSYYEGLSDKTFRLNSKLMLTEKDFTCLKETCCRQILNSVCKDLENTTVVIRAQNLIFQIQNILIIPVEFMDDRADILNEKIERLLVYSQREGQEKMLVGFLQIYQKLVVNLTIVNNVLVMNKRFIKSILLDSRIFSDEVYIEGLNLINCIIKLCGKRPSLLRSLNRFFDRDYKIHTPSKIIETMSENLFNEVMKDKKWHEVSKRPCVQAILNLMRNTFDSTEIQLDEAYLNKLFDNLIKVVTPLYRTSSDNLREAKTVNIFSNTVKQIFSILLEIASIVKHLELSADHYKTLMFWANGDSKKYREIPWMIIAKVTAKRDNFDKFCISLEEICETKLLDAVMVSMLRPTKNINVTMLEQKTLVIVIANILEHKNLCGIELRSITAAIEKLVESNNISALSFIVKSMVRHNFPKTVDLVVSNDIISKLLHFEVTTEFTNRSAFQLISEQIEAFITCLKFKPLQEHVVTTLLNNGVVNCAGMLCDAKDVKNSVYKRFNKSVFSLFLTMIQSKTGLRRMCQIKETHLGIDRFMFASHDNLRTTNTHKVLVFQLKFWNTLLKANDKFNSAFISILDAHELSDSVGYVMLKDPTLANEKYKAKHDEVLAKNQQHIHSAIDLLFLQVVNIFNFTYSSKFSAEYKFVLKSLCFLLIKRLTISCPRVTQLAIKINLFSIVSEKLEMSLAVTQSLRHLETTKKNGVKRSQLMIKDLCIAIKALTEWKLPLKENQTIVKNLFIQTLKISDWLNADSTLMNCFFEMIQEVAGMEIGRNCAMLEIEGVQLPNFILKKTQFLSSKPPHTPTNLALIANGITVLKTLSQFVEVRMIMKNAKLFQMLEAFHPQIQKNRKTTWDDVTIEWMKFFEFLSRYDDTDVFPNHVSLLCRMFRLGNSTIKFHSLKVIQNFSSRSSIGSILLSSDDFPQTVDSILEDSKDNNEKLIILQTLLNIVVKNEKSKAKLKNSPLNRKLKDQLRLIQSDKKYSSTPEKISIWRLTNTLIHFLYPKE